MESLSKSASLLILTSREEEAESLIRSLRNGGLSVQGTFTSKPRLLEELIAANSTDLILCCEYDPDIDIDAWMPKYRSLDRDVPFVIIAGEATESSILVNALRGGARDMTPKGEMDLLQLVVIRELADLEHRQARG